jgi:hypothetical protein
MGITTGIGAGIRGIILTVLTYKKLSKELSDDIEQVTQSLEALQDQVDTLASAVLQNRHALDLLTTEKGGIYFLDEECSFILTNLGWSETWPNN